MAKETLKTLAYIVDGYTHARIKPEVAMEAARRLLPVMAREAEIADRKAEGDFAGEDSEGAEIVVRVRIEMACEAIMEFTKRAAST